MLIRNFQMLFTVIFILFYEFLFVSGEECINITSSVNPGCPAEICNDTNIVYNKVVLPDHSLHLLYSGGKFTKTLSVILIRSPDKSSNFFIDWTKFVNETEKNSITFNGTIENSSGLIFTRLFQYNDKTDSVDMSNQETKDYSFDEFKWIMNNTDKKSVYTSNQFWNMSENIFNDSSISISFRYSCIKGHDKSKPNFIQTGHNIQFDLVLNNLKKKWGNSRFAVELGLFNLHNNVDMQVKLDKIFDDEYSPGVFVTQTLIGYSADEKIPPNMTYLQWKRACYTSSGDQSLNSLSVAHSSNVKTWDSEYDKIFKSSALYKFFGDTAYEVYKNKALGLVNVTFGITGDKYYKGYLQWTASFGQGPYPKDKVSSVIISVISLGLGLPIVLIIAGSIYLLIKKKTSNYDSIN